MEKDELKKMLDNHKLWLLGEGWERADLRRADLRRADLRRADLRRADLRGADLRRADLRGANLREADLRGADLRRADLRGANLREADMVRTDLQGAHGIFQFGPVDTSKRMCYAVMHDTGWMVKAGCFWGTVEDLEERVNNSHKSQVYLGICQILKNWR